MRRESAKRKAFGCAEVAQLAHELSLAPVRHRFRHVDGALRAIELIDAGQEYPFSFVLFQVTGYRPRKRNGDDVMLQGKALLRDLSRLADALTTSTPLPGGSSADRIQDMDVLANRFHVSKKTITRWRDKGLCGCWYASGEAKPVLAFSERSIQVFVSRNRELVRRGASFQLMGASERSRIVSRARELVASEQLSLHAVTLRLSEEIGRAAETIRYTLRRFDQEHPDQALFDRTEQAQPHDEKTVIFAAYSGGDSVSDLALRFKHTEREIRRILTTVRATQLAETPIPYMYNESFDALDADARILGDDSSGANNESESDDHRITGIPSSLPPYLQDLYRTSLLSRDQEMRLFRRMNYLFHRAEMARQRLASRPDEATAQHIAEIDDTLERACETKNQLVQANLRLVVSIAKRHLNGRASANLFELVSDGNIALMRAVEKFDFARGFRFSTYATWAVSRHYARSIPSEIQHQDRFQTGHEEHLSITGERNVEPDRESDAKQAGDAVAGVLKALKPRERQIIQRHFGLANGGETETLDRIGRDLGISKERVRQIERAALVKMRAALGERAIELLAS